MTKLDFNFNPFVDVKTVDKGSNKINDTNVAILQNKYNLSLKNIDDSVNEILSIYGRSATIEQLEQYIIDTYKVEAEEVIEVIKERKIQKEDVIYPLPTHKSVLENKKFPYNTFATLMINSNLDEKSKEAHKNYLYDNRMEEVMDFLRELEIEGAKLTNKRTVERHIKTIIDCGLDLIKVENTDNGIVYKIKPSIDNKYYVRIPYKQIRELLISTNKNMLKLFAFMKVMCNETDFKTIDRKFIAEHIGLSSKSDATIKGIGTMLNSLANLGFIEILETVKVEADAKGNKTVKTINSYRLCTLDEYLNAKGRGKIKRNSKVN